jgi:membrane protein
MRRAAESAQSESAQSGSSGGTRRDAGGDAGGERPGAGAERPGQIPARGWGQIVRRAMKSAKDDGISLAAAGVAFYSFLAIFPAMIAALSIYGLLAEPAQVQQQVSSFSGALPAQAREIIENQLTSLAAGRQGALTLGLVVSVLLALWSASGGIAGLMQAINVAYGERETRGFVKRRGTALGLTIGAIVFVLLSVALVAVLPAVLSKLGLGVAARAGVQVVRWALLLAFVLIALAVAYRFAPDRRSPRIRWVSSGALLATALWIIGSVVFSLYITNFGRYEQTYGAIAGVIILLLWLYLSSYIVLLGAEVNAEMEHQTEVDTTVGEPRRMGERGAVKADTVPDEDGRPRA